MMASGQIKFSVVIPAWNAAATIVQALQSCIDQTYAPYEIIVTDDGSTDQTAAIVRSQFPDVHYIQLPQNGGPAQARNAGWDMATGDFIAFLDADDTWHPDKLRIAAKALNGNSHIRFLFHDYTTGILPAVMQDQPVLSFPFSRLLWRNAIATPCAVLINDPKLRFDETMRYMEDYDLWLRAAGTYRVFHINLPLTRLGRPVLSAGGQSSNRLQMRKGEWQAYIKMAKRHPQYWLLIPLLLGFSAAKHIFKSLAPGKNS